MIFTPTFARILLFSLFATSMFLSTCFDVSGQESHEWSKIAFPNIPTSFGSGEAVPSVRPSNKGIEFSLAFGWTEDDEIKDNFKRPNGSLIKLSLHDANGLKVEPIESNFEGEPLRLTGGLGFSHSSFSCIFPWSENEMLESWIEISTQDRSYWLEIPYGFTRNPKNKKLPTAESGPPQFPPALKPFPEKAQLVNWKHVEYELGEIQNGWRLSLLHANPFDARSEIVLYREDSKVGESMFLWNLRDPVTKLSIAQANGNQLTSRLMSLRLHSDGRHRSDSFEFNRNPGRDRMRDWGTMEIEVGDRQWKTTIPSSLFRYVHGVSDPHHKSTLR